MKARDLERLLARAGGGGAKLDAITRQLRGSRRLPIGGRGPNAPRIDAAEAAALLIALGGSLKASDAQARLELLEGLPAQKGKGGLTLAEMVETLLGDPDGCSDVAEIRISMTTSHAMLTYGSGETVTFGKTPPFGGANAIRIEGVLHGELLGSIASLLNLDDPSNADLGAPFE